MRKYDARRTNACQVHCQLGMPTVGEELKKTFVAIRSREQKGVTLCVLHYLFHAVTDTESVAVYVATKHQEHRPCQMMVSNVCAP